MEAAKSNKRRSENAILVQMWVPRSDHAIIKQAAIELSLPLTTYARTVALADAKTVLEARVAPSAEPSYQ